MKKRLLFIITLITAVAVIGFAFLRKSSQEPLLFPSFSTPTPIAVVGNMSSTLLRLVSITPKDRTEDVPTEQQIQAVFDKTPDRVSFNIYPDVPFISNTQNAQMIITFSQQLEKNTVYSYTFLDSQGAIIFSGSFATGKMSESIAPLSGEYNDLEKIADGAQRENYPDIFLANNVPYETNTFAVTSGFDNTGDGHFFFTTIQKSFSGKSDFLQWLTTLGLTDQQIQKLDLRYK